MIILFISFYIRRDKHYSIFVVQSINIPVFLSFCFVSAARLCADQCGGELLFSVCVVCIPDLALSLFAVVVGVASSAVEIVDPNH